MRALIIAHGESPSAGLLRELADDADLVVAADGGLLVARAAGVEVDAVVGDLDSLDEGTIASLPAGTVHQDTDHDSTDLQKAIEFALSRGATELIMTAVAGGRADHHLANFSVFTLYRDRADITVIDDLFEVTRVEGSATIDAPVGTVVSLVALGDCEGVTTTGLRWNLHDYHLVFSPLGVHNEVRTSPATVSVRSGDLILFRGRFIEKHQ